MNHTNAINNGYSCALDLVSRVSNDRLKLDSQWKHQHSNSRCALIDDNDQYVYRLHFSIVDKNRSWMRGTKRSTKWIFGLANLASLREGKVGRDCRGEEHSVEIVRKQISGKIRIYWNNFEISRFFRQRCFRVDSNYGMKTVEFSWKTRSGEKLQIVGNVDDDLSEESIRFDLFIDNVRFTELPTVKQLGRKKSYTFEERSPANEVTSSIATSDPDVDHITDFEQEFRLSMVGFNSMSNFDDDDNNDELHSDLYTRSLTSLRNQIVRHLPQTEEIVSRAIINACCNDSKNSSPTTESSGSHHIEANYVYDARCWARLNIDFAPRVDVEDLILQYLQRCINEVFVLIRNEELKTTVAARIVFDVAAVLGLEFSVGIEQNTILMDLPACICMGSLYGTMSQFGEIEVISLASKSTCFGLCRYVHESSAFEALSTFYQDALQLNDIKLSLPSMLPAVPDLLNVSSDETEGEYIDAIDSEERGENVIITTQRAMTFLGYDLDHHNSSPRTVLHDINTYNNNNCSTNRNDMIRPVISNNTTYCSSAASCY